MKIPNTTIDYQVSLDILREQHQTRHECSFSSPGSIIGLTVFIFIVVAVTIIPTVTSVDPNIVVITDCLKEPSLKRPFGTDEFDRGLMARVPYEARVSLLAGGTVALLSCALGTAISIYASYFKTLDHIPICIYEGLIAISGVLLMITLMATLGTSNLNMIIVLTTVYTSSVVRIVRSSALVTRERPYMEAAKVQEAGSGYILRKLIPPDVISPLMVQVSLVFVQVITSETSPSFLGAGIPAPAVSWGNILQGSKQALQKAS